MALQRLHAALALEGFDRRAEEDASGAMSGTSTKPSGGPDAFPRGFAGGGASRAAATPPARGLSEPTHSRRAHAAQLALTRAALDAAEEIERLAAFLQDASHETASIMGEIGALQTSFSRISRLTEALGGEEPAEETQAPPTHADSLEVQ
ncbi:hypothetical protein AB1Y20_017820 [Prymnesium parvum]|uniref:Uncharacterized protein n=1 Tax=Prymnesium parvum TaxID=97485 RepID=A0AB34JP83_PRYPA